MPQHFGKTWPHLILYDIEMPTSGKSLCCSAFVAKLILTCEVKLRKADGFLERNGVQPISWL